MALPMTSETSGSECARLLSSETLAKHGCRSCQIEPVQCNVIIRMGHALFNCDVSLQSPSLHKKAIKITSSVDDADVLFRTTFPAFPCLVWETADINRQFYILSLELDLNGTDVWCDVCTR